MNFSTSAWVAASDTIMCLPNSLRFVASGANLQARLQVEVCACPLTVYWQETMLEAKSFGEAQQWEHLGILLWCALGYSIFPLCCVPPFPPQASSGRRQLAAS